MALSAINQRRLAIFKANKRALYSFWLFVVLFFASLFADLIANDKPIFISYQQSWFWPTLVDYPETEFGGFFETTTDYNDPAIQELIEAEGFIVWAPVPFSYDTHIANLNAPAPTAPDRQNILGTDDQARDVFARVIYGFRISILFALALGLSSSVLGILVGALQGYYGGKVDLIGQRLIEIWSGLPALFLLIILSGVVTPSFWWILFIMLLFSWTQLVDVVRAEFLRGRNLDYVRAAKALGVSDALIMWRHILPNAMVATMTLLPFILAGAISSLTALDFLGFGLPPGSASLGELVAQAKANLHAPWLAISAFSVLALTLTLLVFIGEGVRDAFDPRANLT